MTVRKAVIPVAGFGTRFLPATRSVPKNLLPAFDVPSIHFCVQEAALAGIEDVIFVVSDGQEAIARYFEQKPALERALAGRDDPSMLQRMLDIPCMANISLVEQTEQKGLGHAVLMARELVGDEPFAVFLPDDLIWAERPTIGEMIKIHERAGANVIAIKQVPDEAVPNLGIVAVESVSDTTSRIVGMVEKPALQDAPSNLAIIGRYVLDAGIFDTLERLPPGALGEIQLTDAIARHIEAPGVYGYRFSGEHHDVGTPLGMLKASLSAALRREDLRDDIQDWMRAALEQDE